MYLPPELPTWMCGPHLVSGLQSTSHIIPHIERANALVPPTPFLRGRCGAGRETGASAGRPGFTWRRTIPLSQGYRIRADGTVDDLRAVYSALAAVATVRELQSQELHVEQQAGYCEAVTCVGVCVCVLCVCVVCCVCCVCVLCVLCVCVCCLCVCVLCVCVVCVVCVGVCVYITVTGIR